MKHHSKVLRKPALAAASIVLGAVFAAPMLTGPVVALASGDVNGLSPYHQYEMDYDTQEELITAERELNLQIAAEGTVLLKNKNNALPLKAASEKVTLFHSVYNPWEASDLMTLGGGGSGCIVRYETTSSIYDGFDEVGVKYNPTMRQAYDERGAYNKGNSLNTVKGPVLEEIKKEESSFAEYKDAAIISITRTGSEAADITSMMQPSSDSLHNGQGFWEKEEGVEHYLQLNNGEKALIEYAKGKFDKVIILLNTPGQMEIAGLEDDDEIDAILWIGFPGENGMLATAQVLAGEREPSGRLTDTWAVNMDQDPTWQNFGYNLQNGGDTFMYYVDDNPFSQGDETHTSVDYEEGIYVGYKFYETASDIGYFDATKPEQGNDMPKGVSDRFYNRTNGVIYPFGYGLSYTSFTQEIVESSKKTDGDTIEFDVKVKNTGTVAGKDVVQVYYNPPYTDGGIEKSTANLIAFEKTGEIKPQGEETVHITFTKREMASYDYGDANHDNHKGYELEKGKYEISVNKNSHEQFAKFEYDHAAQTNYDNDEVTGTKIENQFSNEDEYDVDGSVFRLSGEPITFLSRAPQGDERNPFVATFPTKPTHDDLKYKTELNEWFLHWQYYNDPEDEEKADKGNEPWITDAEIPEGWTQAAVVDGKVPGRTLQSWTGVEMADITLTDMIGIEENDEVFTDEGVFAGKTGNEAWEMFMNQLTYDELEWLVSHGLYGTKSVWSVGKPYTVDSDGPAQSKTMSSEYYRPGLGFASGVVLASTWNQDLACEYGRIMGNRMTESGATGWYGPSINIHRSPLGGRNFEYLSEDAILSGYMAAGMVKGAAEKGIITYMKHFAMNNQESDRHSVCEWTNEQAMREIYLKPFEIAVKKGGATGIMTSFNRIGMFYATENYRLMVNILEKEWGFKGAAITDYYGDVKWKGDGLVHCHVFPMGDYDGNTAIQDGTWDAQQNCVKVNGEKNDALWYAVRKTAQRIMYTTANSNIMEQPKFMVPINEGDDVVMIFPQGTMLEKFFQLSPVGGNEAAYDESLHYYQNFVTGNYKLETLDGQPLPACSHHGDGWVEAAPGVHIHETSGNSFVGGCTTPGTWSCNIIYTSKKTGQQVTARLNIIITSGFDITETKGELNKPFESKIVRSIATRVANIKQIELAEGCTLPAGLSLDTATGAISGTPTEAGQFDLSFKITGTYEQWGTQHTATYDYFTTLSIGDFPIHFDLNGEPDEFAENVIDVMACENASVEAPAVPERDGYRFGGWYLDENCTERAYLDKGFGEETTLYARWLDKNAAPEIDIGENGHWFIDGQDTGISATGPQGEKGEKGDTGETGATGPQGAKGETGAAGPKGDTGAAGKDGTNGQDGKDGVTPQVEIGENGNWFINGQDTGVKAAAETGGGCGGVIGIGGAIVATVTILGAAVLVIRKKKD